jgi:hypothetical protein
MPANLSSQPGNTSNWTGRTPRTMAQAFGPGARLRGATRRPGTISQALGFLASVAICGAPLTMAFVVATDPTPQPRMEARR